jgi:hypothetical protein
MGSVGYKEIIIIAAVSTAVVIVLDKLGVIKTILDAVS